MGRKPVFVKHDKKVAHLAQLMLLVCDPQFRDQCNTAKVMRPCVSGKCFKPGLTTPPEKEHLKVRTPGQLVYVCLDCGYQMIIEGLSDLDKIEEMPFELQKLAVQDKNEFSAVMNAYLYNKKRTEG